MNYTFSTVWSGEQRILVELRNGKGGVEICYTYLAIIIYQLFSRSSRHRMGNSNDENH